LGVLTGMAYVGTRKLFEESTPVRRLVNGHADVGLPRFQVEPYEFA
jgi:hypothetical protein